MNVYKWIVIVLEVLSALAIVGTTGKPRATVTPGAAVLTIIVTAGLVLLVVLA